MTFSRWEIELIGALVIVAAALAWLGFHDASIKREAVAPILASVQAAQEAASAAVAIKAVQVDAAQKGNLRDAQDEIRADARTIAGLRGVVADAYRLRDAAIHRAAAAEAAGSAASGAAGGDTGTDMVQGGLLAAALDARAEAESDAADLAVYVAGLRTSGQLCAKDYDAVADR